MPSIGDVLAPDRSQLDLARADQIRRAVRHLSPDLIVNAAACTQVDQAENDQRAAYPVNAKAPALLAEEAKAIGAALIHNATDYVLMA